MKYVTVEFHGVAICTDGMDDDQRNAFIEELQRRTYIHVDRIVEPNTGVHLVLVHSRTPILVESKPEGDEVIEFGQFGDVNFSVAYNHKK